MSSAEKVDAWMPLWIGAYLADTMTLTTQQHGAYLLLLFAYWRNRGPLDDDDEALASIVKASAHEWETLRSKLSRFFTVADGRWSHGRADRELAAAEARRSKAASKAKAAAEARWAKNQKHPTSNAPSMPQALHEQCPTPSPIPSLRSGKVSKASPSHPPAGGKGARFMEFWEAWPKSERKQDRAKCWEYWRAKGLDAIADQILADIRVKRGTTKWQDGFIEAPLVYLRGKRWEDGVQPDGGDGGSGVVDWTETRKGVEGKAAEVGMPAWTETEPFGAYRARVLRAAGVEPRKVA